MTFLTGLFLAASALAQPKKPAPKAPAGDKKGSDDIEMAGDTAPAGSGSATVDPNEIDMGSDAPEPPKDLTTDLQTTENNTVVKAGPIRKTPLSWADIVTVVRKPFLKVRRTELYPFVGTTMNDNMVRHYTVGGELAYYLTDVLAIGVEGMYYKSAFREPFDLVARQARRLPTVNEYKWSAALDFHYVPVYGKFAILDKRLVTWEVAFTAGIGAGQSEVIPRDTKFPGFTNFLIMPNVGANMRFFIAKWLTVNVGIRDYVFIDKFEPTNRDAMTNATAEAAKDNADTSIINNVMFQIGVSFWLPTSFEYTTFR
ncbi:MAG: outer membrane beta-barrel domain-containing protein [Kofleriaceae bacterium]